MKPHKADPQRNDVTRGATVQPILFSSTSSNVPTPAGATVGAGGKK